jgi:hypothetical protein
MKIKTLIKFVEFIKKCRLSLADESIARTQFLLDELDDDYFMNREKRRVS